MSDPATLLPAPRFAFGAHRIDALDRDVIDLAGSGATVLVVADPGVIAAGLVARAERPLRAAGLDTRIHAIPPGEPKAAGVDGAAAVARETGAGCVVGIGGGSALDVAKLSAVASAAEASVVHYALAANPLPARTCALLLVPTTAGTGSEATTTAIFSDRHRKLWVWGESLRPDRALLDPGLSTGLPAALTAATGADALVHAIEAYTARRNPPAAEDIALAAVCLVARNLQHAVEHPADLEARGRMLVAAALAGLAIDTSGTGVAHAIGHALGSVAGVHHGRAVALSLRAALAWNAEAAPGRHARIATALGVEPNGMDEAALAHAGATAFEDLLRRCHLAFPLADHGLGPGDLQRIVAAAMEPENAPMRENNVRPVTRADIERITADVLAAT